ncbi:PNLIP, partial [Cordylochernes scorpioides]
MHPLWRPLSLLPKPPDTFSLLFWLFTRDNPMVPQFLFVDDPKSLETSNFDPSRPTKVLIHGYQDNLRLTAWMSKLRDALLQHGDYNVVVVDWSLGALPPYAQAVANTRVVGAEVARLIYRLQLAAGAVPETFHLIGHSLGAHVAGYAGKRTWRLGRITGLDPAGLFFQKMPSKVRLHWEDALFVDVIHSDAKEMLTLYPLQGFGTDEVLGHADMFPNNGSYNQTDCRENTRKALNEDGLPDGVSMLLGCDHIRSIYYFHQSIVSPDCLPVGVRCESWDDFLQGRCADCGPDDSQCAAMGLRADLNRQVLVPRGPRRFYLLTSTRPPYC